MTTLADPPLTLDPVSAALLELADCVCNELAATAAGPTCWCGLWPGLEVSWEYCGECSGGACGMGFVQLILVAPYDEFPNPVIDVRCVKPLVAQIEVGALRCIPQPEDGTVLAPAPMSEVALLQMQDALALYRAVQCCGVELAIGAYTPAGPQGGCVGGSWTAFVPLG